MSLEVKFSAKDINLTETVSKIKREMEDMDDEVKKTSTGVKTSFGDMVKAGAALALGFGAIKLAANAIAGTMDTFKAALDLGGTMKDLSARTGETAGNLMLLNRAFDNSGVGADKVGTSINKLQKFMDDAAQGGKKQTEVLGRLGLTMADMAGKTPTEQMAMLAERFKGVTDSGERSALAISIFGKAGGVLLPLLADFSGEMKTAQDQLGSMPGVLDRSAGAFDNISDNINVAKGKFLEFAAGLLESIAPALELATDLMTRFDAAGAGMKLGEILTGASNAMGGFTDALSAVKLGEFKLAFKIAFEGIKLQAADSINSIATNVMAAAQAASTFIVTAFGPGSGIFTMISAQFDILAASFTKSMIGGAKAIAEALNIPFSDFDDAFKKAEINISQAQNKISNSTQQIAGDFVLAGQEMGKSFDSALSNSQQLINTSEIEVKLQQYRNKLKKLEAEATSEAAVAAADKLTHEELSLKTAKDRLTHEERIKELDADIASAKRKGNKEELGELEALKAFHLELESSKQRGLTLQEAITNATQSHKNVLDGALTKQKNITKELVKQLGLGEKILADAKAAERKDRLDPGGKMEKAAAEAIGKGNFGAAGRIGRTLQSRERDRAFQEAFGKKEGGIGRSVTDIAKEQGIDTFGKTKRQLQEELMKKRQAEMKPGAEGKKEGKPGEPVKPPAAAPENLLQKAVDAIKLAVESLEKKLPMPALGV